MAKLVSGVLCRDDRPAGLIRFFGGANSDEVEIPTESISYWMQGRWEGPRSRLRLPNRVMLLKYGQWTLETWRAAYDLEPPRKGRCFEVEIEL